MKKIIIAVTCLYFLSACSLFKKGTEKKGCQTDGRNVGAEKLLTGDDKEAMKRAKKGNVWDGCFNP
jgi:protein involved in sex pheromone biosynthesis